MTLSSLSVFFPAYNEEENLRPTVEKAVVVLKEFKFPWELLIINDGSHDSTGAIADTLAKENSAIRVIHKANGGYGSAIKAGLSNAKNDWVFFTDSDGQFDFSEIKKLIDLSDQADIIVGYRIDRQDPFMRKLNGWGWTLINNLLFGLGVKDVDCAFKLMKKEVINAVMPLESQRGAMISPELLAKAKKKGFKIKEVGVGHFPRTAGNPTGANLSVIVKSFIDLFRLWLKIR